MKKFVIITLLVALVPVGLFAYGRSRHSNPRESWHGMSNGYSSEYNDCCGQGRSWGGRHGMQEGRGRHHRYFNNENYDENYNYDRRPMHDPELWTYDGEQWLYDGEALDEDFYGPGGMHRYHWNRDSEEENFYGPGGMHRYYRENAPEGAPETQQTPETPEGNSEVQEDGVIYLVPYVG